MHSNSEEKTKSPVIIPPIPGSAPVIIPPIPGPSPVIIPPIPGPLLATIPPKPIQPTWETFQEIFDHPSIYDNDNNNNNDNNNDYDKSSKKDEYTNGLKYEFEQTQKNIDEKSDNGYVESLKERIKILETIVVSNNLANISTKILRNILSSRNYACRICEIIFDNESPKKHAVTMQPCGHILCATCIKDVKDPNFANGQFVALANTCPFCFEEIQFHKRIRF